MKHNVIPKIYMVFGWIVENYVFIDEKKEGGSNIFLNFSGALDRVSDWKLLQIMKYSLFISLDYRAVQWF